MGCLMIMKMDDDPMLALLFSQTWPTGQWTLFLRKSMCAWWSVVETRRGEEREHGVVLAVTKSGEK